MRPGDEITEEEIIQRISSPRWRELVQAYLDGEEIVLRSTWDSNSERPDGRWPVLYMPRRDPDDFPWVLADDIDPQNPSRFAWNEVESIGVPRKN